MKTQLLTLAAAVAALATAAADVQQAGAIRPDHEQRFSSLRTSIDQIADQVDQALKIAEAETPETPDATAFGALTEKLTATLGKIDALGQAFAEVADQRHTLETVALTLDHLSDQVAALQKAQA